MLREHEMIVECFHSFTSSPKRPRRVSLTRLKHEEHVFMTEIQPYIIHIRISPIGKYHEVPKHGVIHD